MREIHICSLAGREAHPISPAIYVTALILSIFFLLSCPQARATDLPTGSYFENCQGMHMSGNNLEAQCKNYFGNLQNTVLVDAPACASGGHDIANVNGLLRCVFLWDPNGIGVISRTTSQDKENSTILWIIDQPMVRQPETYYNQISFKAGDSVTIGAGGCVQTGGMGATWKSYTNPLGDSADSLYSGLIWIPGVISNMRIGGVLNRVWRVPDHLQPPVLAQLFLRLGYQDDNYGDNGYYSHDNGNDNQCLNVGPAWVEIKIVRPFKAAADDKAEWTPASKPFDLIWDAEDTQGLPLNPRWFSQKNNPEVESDFNAICGPAISGQDTIHVDVLAERCSSQSPYADLSTSWMDGLSFPGVDGGAGFCEADVLKGHLNWAIATTTGTFAKLSWTTGTMQDDDYNVYMNRSNHALLDSSNPSDGPGLAMEFNSDESIHQFQSPWWAQLDSQVEGSAGDNGTTDVPATSPAGELLTEPRPVVAIGLIGVDGVHGHVESHPVFALAIQSGTTEAKDSRDETWEFFVRNFGNEGNCSHLIHYWDGLSGQYYIQLPNPPEWSDVSGVTVTSSNAFLWGTIFLGTNPLPVSEQNKAEVHVEKDSEATYIAVSLPPPQETGSTQLGWGVNGQVTIHYTLKANSARKVEEKKGEPARSARVKADFKSEELEGRWNVLEKHIPDATVKTRVEQIFLAAFPAAKGVKQPNKRLVIEATVREHKKPMGVHHGALTRTHTAIDPRKVKLDSDLKSALTTTFPKETAKPAKPR